MTNRIKRLLVAEDDQDVKRIYHFILESAGYELINAHNGQEAVDKYKEHRPDAVIMDIRMPVKNGDVAIREILEFDPDAKLVAVTAYNYHQNQLGVPVLRKGFHRQDLLDLIEKL